MKKIALKMIEIDALYCEACEQIICPYCSIEDGEIMYSNMCQGHVENLTPKCNHMPDEDEE